MSDYVIPDPEPKEIDEKLSIELRHPLRQRGAQGPSLRRREVRELPLLPGEHRGDLVLLAPEAAHPRGRRVVVPVVGGDPHRQLSVTRRLGGVSGAGRRRCVRSPRPPRRGRRRRTGARTSPRRRSPCRCPARGPRPPGRAAPGTTTPSRGGRRAARRCPPTGRTRRPRGRPVPSRAGRASRAAAGGCRPARRPGRRPRRRSAR